MNQPDRAVVTGATSGIGEAIARGLASRGRTVVLIGRSRERLEQAAQRIGSAVPGADLRLERADLSLLTEVRALADRLEPAGTVVSNAAVIAPLDDVTAEGLPRTVATNHLAPYLLLRSLAERGDTARFVIVGADPGALARVPVDVENPLAIPEGGIPSVRPFILYGRTKNMNAMFGYALARRLAGTGATVNGAHPGVIRRTGLGRHSRGVLKLFGAALSVAGPGPDAGADTPVWLATSAEGASITGRFFVKRKEVATAPHTTDVARCDRLWEASERLVNSCLRDARRR